MRTALAEELSHCAGVAKPSHLPCPEQELLGRRVHPPHPEAQIAALVLDGHAALMRPSCCSAVTPSSRPTSSVMRPFSILRTGVPVKRIVLPVLAGNAPMGMSSKASPVWVPPPSHWPMT